MQISDFVPALQPMAEDISVNLRYICFFVLTASIIVKTAQAGTGNISRLIKPLVTAAFICGLIATIPFWFNLIRDEFWNIAVSIRQEFASSVAPTGTALLQLIKPPEGGINWLDIGNSLMKAVQFALGWLVVCVAGMVQLPMMIVQFIMECLCYMFLPIALTLFALDSTRGLGMRYVQQTLAILAWPIGFAVVDLVGYSILTGPISAGSALALGIGAATKFTPATLILGCIVGIWLILGSLATPIVMQLLFCSGSPMSSAIGHALQLGLGAAGMAKLAAGSTAKSPGAIAAGAPATAVMPLATTLISPTASSSLPALMGAMQRAALPPPSSSSPAALKPPPKPLSPSGLAIMPPRGHTQPKSPPAIFDLASDPSGDRFAMNVKQLDQIPSAVSY